MSFKTLARLGPFQLQRIVCDILARIVAFFRRRKPEPKPHPTDSATVAAIIAACDP